VLILVRAVKGVAVSPLLCAYADACYAAPAEASRLGAILRLTPIGIGD
jgi:hypothetical protein